MRRFLDLDKKENELSDLENEMTQPHFWDDQSRANQVVKQVSTLKETVKPFLETEKKFSDLEGIYPDAKEMGDEDLLNELKSEADLTLKMLEELEIKKMLSGELDPSNCFLSINAGAGGTESCDWALMLMRMYQRWAQKRGFKCNSVDMVDGEVAGIKSVTLKIEGPFAYGYAKAEKGVHRLVRISPFDSNAKRHTSFASVDVSPEIDDAIEIEIKPDDIRIDTYRASGAGGQHVNKTESAVRITHHPSGIVVSCQNERSQVQNKETCFKMLKSKLYEKQVLEREASLKELGGEKMDIGWGSQIRNYVFQPYTLVKDNRTKFEVGNIQAVMDGDIDPFITAYLKEFG
ncbi:MAG: peptide chain release factor 2 [Rhabdochlamydiaceae bacterium]|nr:peptide chain release factor 2 [Candidatus Amphrikana amoebophyrae]